ncbi:exopolysaccharide biosynthesis protein [Kushneria sp. Sum13]|uniref:exopolysaccharide biosynthesis protein n=1 Tax=Kushneria sp. Sum13 TaxID=3459196 RepID=UPI00404609CF
MAETTRLSELMTSLDKQHEGSEVSLDDLMTIFHSRSFGPLLVTPPLIALALPIFGLPTLCGVVMALVAIQQVMGRSNPWLPRRLRQLSINGQRFHRTVEKINPWVMRLERLFRPRLAFMDNEVIHRVVAMFIVLISLSIPFVEPLPMGPALPCAMLMLVALGMLMRDGLAVLIGLVVAVAGMASLLLLL